MPIVDPYPDEDFVTVVFKDNMAQIKLDENYPNSTQDYVRIGEFNCDGKSTSLFSQVFVFV
jgi:hypothetical protein